MSYAEFAKHAQPNNYCLTREGFQSFHAKVTPKWEAVSWYAMSGLQTQESLKVLASYEFWVDVDSAGKVRLSHSLKAGTKRVLTQASLQQIESALRNTIGGFIQSIFPFMFNTFPPADPSAKLARKNGLWEISAKSKAMFTIVLLDNRFALKQMNFGSPPVQVLTKYQTNPTAKGNVITQARSQLQLGKEKEFVTYAVKYKKIDGLLLPATLNGKVTGGPRPNQCEITFSQFKVVRALRARQAS